MSTWNHTLYPPWALVTNLTWRSSFSQLAPLCLQICEWWTLRQTIPSEIQQARFQDLIAHDLITRKSTTRAKVRYTYFPECLGIKVIWCPKRLARFVSLPKSFTCARWWKDTVCYVFPLETKAVLTYMVASQCSFLTCGGHDEEHHHARFCTDPLISHHTLPLNTGPNYKFCC